MAGSDELKRLQDEVLRRGEAAFLLSTGDNGEPHAIATLVRWLDDRLSASTGGRSRRNVSARPFISFLWPPPEPGGYALVIDAEAVLDDDVVHAHPTRGLLHRLGPGLADSAAYSSDCIWILNP